MEMIYCGPGTFLMGSPVSESGRDADETQHRVTLTKGFWLSKYKVTQAQWISVMGGNAYQTSGLNSAMYGISWYDCSKYVAKINSDLRCNARIPTEAEWEYACRAASSSSDENGWGFIDMECGELEWCFDCYRDEFSLESVYDPIIDKPYYGQDDRRVVRGGDRWNWHFSDHVYKIKTYFTEKSRFADRLSAPPKVPYVLYCEGKGYVDPNASDPSWTCHECYIGFRLCCAQLPRKQ
jgi:formylglycine-generating enzyme required for sulfatase activity